MDRPYGVTDYIRNRIESLSHVPESKLDRDVLVDSIYRYLTSSKYRRHSMTDGYDTHIRGVIARKVKRDEPIPLVWVFGCYKLWRLKESPFVDWAELFFLMHKIDWLKPILAIYKPGVIFDFFADGILVPKLNNISEEDMILYKKSFLNLLNFINKKVPPNLKFTLNTLEDLYGSKLEFESEFKENYKNVVGQDRVTPYKLTSQQESIIRLNVKSDHNLNKKELHENQLLFEAFVLSSKRRPYYRNEEKIFLDSFPIKNCLPVGSTRSSTVRFWVGKGALKKFKDSYLEEILSMSQIERCKMITTGIDGFEILGSNFKSISLVE